MDAKIDNIIIRIQLYCIAKLCNCAQYNVTTKLMPVLIRGAGDTSNASFFLN